MARLLRQLEEIRGDYDRLEERYNALAGTLRSIQQKAMAMTVGEWMIPGHNTGKAVREVADMAQRALAFAGDPEIDR